MAQIKEVKPKCEDEAPVWSPAHDERWKPVELKPRMKGAGFGLRNLGFKV